MAKTDTLKIGFAVFLDQPINISGGIKPSNVSEIKKVIRTPILEKELVSNSKPSSIVKTYSLTKNSSPTIRIIGIADFFKLFPRKA